MNFTENTKAIYFLMHRILRIFSLMNPQTLGTCENTPPDVKWRYECSPVYLIALLFY